MNVSVPDVVIVWDPPVNQTGSNATIYFSDPGWLAAYEAERRRRAFALKLKRHIGWKVHW